MKKSYNGVILIPTFQERLEYLRCHGNVGKETFGVNRWLNQELYHSEEWLNFRREIILRDECCDLAHTDFPLDGYYDKDKDKVINVHRITVHHINIITAEDLVNNARKIFDPDNVITTCGNTHREIHYGFSRGVPVLVERTPNDTCPWKR